MAQFITIDVSPQQHIDCGELRIKLTVIHFFYSTVNLLPVITVEKKIVLISLLNQMYVQRAEQTLNQRDTSRSLAI